MKLDAVGALAATGAGLGRAGRLTPGGLRSAIVRAVMQVAPDKARERRKAVTLCRPLGGRGVVRVSGWGASGPRRAAGGGLKHWCTGLSQPGLGLILGARVPGESGDDPHRYASGKARKNYAATSPLTRASGKKKVVTARFVRNDRLTDALMAQAFASLSASPGARALYDEATAWPQHENTLAA